MSATPEHTPPTVNSAPPTALASAGCPQPEPPAIPRPASTLLPPVAPPFIPAATPSAAPANVVPLRGSDRPARMAPPAIVAAPAERDRPVPAKAETALGEQPLGLDDPLLGIAADALDDLERTRIANANRVGVLTRSEADSDGRVRGFGLDEQMPAVANLQALIQGLAALEHEAELQLRRRLRSHPLYPWVKNHGGVGEKQAARLLAALRDPYWNTLHDRPRTLGELRAYAGVHVLLIGQAVTYDAHTALADEDQLPASQCVPGGHRNCAGGAQHPVDQQNFDNRAADVDRSSTPTDQIGSKLQSICVGGAQQDGSDPDYLTCDGHRDSVGVAAVRARGQRSNWNATVKMRLWNIAQSTKKQLRAPCARPDGQPWASHVDGCSCSPYRLTYDDGRRKYAQAVHQVPCRRCGPKGHPAPVGSPLSLAHQEARADRLVMRQILRDLWEMARDLHERAGA
jgi:hypothetical protein